MPELRRISSLDVREPAVRFMIGWRKALRANVLKDCEWDEHSEAGYEEGKRVKAALLARLSKTYGTTFHVIDLQQQE